MERLSCNIIKNLLKQRRENTHKGDYGHSLLIVGSQNKMGAALIASRACLRTGTGLLSVSVPENERFILQIGIPEAMIVFREKIIENISTFSSIGFGCATGLSIDTRNLLMFLISEYNKPMVLDADAISMISHDVNLLKNIRPNTIITPHSKEFDRLFGKHNTTQERINTAINKAQKYNIIIVLKGHNTLITSNGRAYINSTGNAGLAKGGSGDALTGIITALLSQNYNPIDAAIIGVYIHGLSADITLEKQSMESMLITDVIENLGQAFKTVRNDMVRNTI